MSIYKGTPGASMPADILLQKHEYHVPFYRQVKQPKHLGVKLSKNTMIVLFRIDTPPVTLLYRKKPVNHGITQPTSFLLG